MSHLSARVASAALAIAVAGGVGLGQSGPSPDTSRFTILVRGIPVGSETVTLTRTGNGWLISASGRIAPPVDLVTSRFEMAYASDWQPQTLSIESMWRGQLVTLATSFGLTTALNDMLQGGQKSAVTHQVSPRTVVLPNNFYGAYEALAARLADAAVGTRLPVYVAPQAEVTATVDAIASRRVVTPSGAIDLRQFDLTIANPAGPIGVEVWIDSRNRLARVRVPAASLAVLREDIASVMAREETIRNPGDDETFIPATGFSLAATVTKPSTGAGRLPAVVLVAGSGPQDRDETVFGIPVFGQLAGALASAGYFVVRYDKRGVGQSGGRIERATLDDYAGDVVSVVNWLRKRKDIDGDRIAVVGHSEGGAVAMLVASRGNHVAALGLLAAPGLTGRGVTMWQQQHALARMTIPEPEKQAKVDLQMRVMDAVVSGRGWEGVPDEVRFQADTSWFRSWLLFDPRATMAKVEQPVLIVQGALDMQIPAEHADLLMMFSRSRKVPETHTRKVVIAGVNHLLVPATTGEVEEYPRLAAKTISAEVTSALTDWLKSAIAKR